MPLRIRKALKGESAGSEIAQAEHAAGDGEAEIPESLAQHHAAIFRAGLREHGIAVVAGEVERAAIDDHAADGIAVAAEELGGGMDDDVGAVLEGP